MQGVRLQRNIMDGGVFLSWASANKNPRSLRKPGSHSMSIVSIIALAALLCAFLFLLISLRVPPLYSDPEAKNKVKNLNTEKNAENDE